VLAGGGSGEDMLRRLSLCGYTVICGPLNRGDSDAEVASALGIPAPLEKPFSPLSATILEQSRQDAEAVEAVIVCGVPFGPGNVAALSLAEAALASGKPVFIMGGVSERDYTPQRDATAILARLTEQGAQPWSTPAELMTRLPTTQP
jgi:iron complex transport system ATP-binding protein